MVASLASLLVVLAPALAGADGRTDDAMRAPWPQARSSGESTPTSAGEVRQGRWLGLALLDLYRLLVSPRLQARCGFTPSCSRYASLAVARHGLLCGWFRAADRLMRCTPFRDPGDYPRHAGRCVDSP